MKKQLLSLLILVALPMTVWAGKVTREQALKTATSFMNGKTFTEDVSYSRTRRRSQKVNEEPFYVFNATDGGYVIVSGDDRTREILGYSPTGTLDMDNLPTNLAWWLDEYARQIESLGTSTTSVTTSLEKSSLPPISPLIHTKWSQSAPYNYMCPDGNGRDYYESDYDTDNRCATGCVATAMAQVMNYWKWPESCPTLEAYSAKNFNVNSLPSTTFKWDLMKDSYKWKETGDAANAVAELMRYCGQAVKMGYGTDGSSGVVSKEVMVETFNYSPNIWRIWRDNYNLEDWESIIYNELVEGRPVLYSGQSNSGGHEFVIDGYSSNGLFHINWGWGGYCDDYFVLSVADPDQPGVDGGSSSDGYRYGQEALIGVKPFREGEMEPYCVLSDNALTVTFYYDGHMISRKGMAIDWYYGKEPAYQTATSAIFDESFANYYPYSTVMWFYGCNNLKEIKGTSNLNTNKVTSMDRMFSGCSGLTSLDVSNFKTDNVTSMDWMFSDCSGLTSLDLSKFKTDNVTSMNYMFYNCSSLTSLDVSKFKTDNVTSMGSMFYNCSRLTSLDVSKFKTDNVKNMNCMFYNCSGLTSLDVSKFKTDNVTSMSWMFYNCSSLTSLDVSKFKTANVTSMGSMFCNCSSLTSLDVSLFKTDNVTSMNNMFNGCSRLTSLDVSLFKTDNVLNMSGMFYNCSSLTSLDVSKFKTANVTSMGSMFCNCSSLTSLDVSSFKTDNVTSMDWMFGNCSSLTSLDLNSFKTDNVTSMYSMFYNCSSLTNLDLSSFNTDNVTSMGGMFSGCSTLTNLDVSKFKTDNVTNMYSMFYDCSSLTSLDMSNFKTDNVTYMNYMFCGCSSLTSLDMSNFKTDNVTNMSYMFFGCSKLTTIYVGENWSTDNVKDSSWMFYCAKLVGGQDTKFDLSYTDHTYARIDGGVEAPGYFTYKESTDIHAVNSDSDSGTRNIFDIKGIKHEGYVKGLNIIRMSDGTTKKVLVK